MVSDDGRYEICLMHISSFIKEDALEAVQKYAATSNKENAAYRDGMMMAYYNVLDTIKQHAEVNEIPLSEVSLEGFNLEAELFRKA